MWRCCWSTATWTFPHRHQPDEAKPYFTMRRLCSCRNSAMWMRRVCNRSLRAFAHQLLRYRSGDTSLFVYQPLSFEPKMSLTQVADLLVAAMIVLPALVIWAWSR